MNQQNGTGRRRVRMRTNLRERRRARSAPRGNMQRLQSALAALCIVNLLSPASTAQDRTPTLEPPHGILHRYEPTHTPPVDLSNSSRLDPLLRPGNPYLSQQAAIPLPLRNHVHISPPP